MGSFRPQYPQTYPQNFQPPEMMPAMTRTRSPPAPCTGPLAACRPRSPSFIMLLPKLTTPVHVARKHASARVAHSRRPLILLARPRAPPFAQQHLTLAERRYVGSIGRGTRAIVGPHVSPFRAGPPQEPPEEERPPGVEGPPEAFLQRSSSDV